MSGDVHVQFCERPGVRFPRATHLALFADDPRRLAAWRARAEAFLGRRRLSLHPRKTHVAPTAAPATFLGFELRPGGRRRLPEENVRRFRNRLRGLRDRWRARKRVAGGGGAARHRVGGARGARPYVAAAPRDLPGRGGVVRTARTAGPGGLTGPCRRVLRGGSWNNNPAILRSANRNNNDAGARNDNNGFRVSSTLRCRSRRGHGRAGRAWVRPGPVMMSRRRRICAAASRLAPVLVPGGRRAPAARSSGEVGSWGRVVGAVQSCGASDVPGSGASRVAMGNCGSGRAAPDCGPHEPVRRSVSPTASGS